MQIGFIGLGRLGTPIARNLLSAGHQLTVYNRTLSKAQALAEDGARVAESLAGLAAASDILFSMVTDDAALRAIFEGPTGLLTQLKPGSIHVSMSTILPETAAVLAGEQEARGQVYIAAPVFGRPEAAAARKLNFVLSGPETALSLVTPYLKDAGALNVWNLGASIRAANTVKLCGNFLIAAANEAIGETVALARKSGVDPEMMWKIFAQTLFNSPIYQGYYPAIIREQYEPAAFTMKLGLKDLNLVNEQARQVNQSMPLASLLRAQMEKLVDAGMDQIDWSGISKAIELE